MGSTYTELKSCPATLPQLTLTCSVMYAGCFSHLRDTQRSVFPLSSPAHYFCPLGLSNVTSYTKCLSFLTRADDSSAGIVMSARAVLSQAEGGGVCVA